MRPTIGHEAAATTALDTGCGLSDRERQVLALIADGLSNRDIGARLVISEKTAGRHVSNIFTKLEVHTRARAARYAAEHGLLGP